MKPLYVIALAVLLICLTGCRTAPQETAAPPSVLPTAAVDLQPPTPTDTPIPPPTETPAPLTLQAEVTANVINLRAGPSMLHNIIGQYQKGEVVTVMGTSPGRQWLKVSAKENKWGWMNLVHVQLSGEISGLPLIPITESLVLTGKVMNASQVGIPGITVGAVRRGGAGTVRIEGTTNAEGVFYAYAPIEYQGNWVANVIGIDCASPIVDANCRYAGVFTPAEGIDLLLPQDKDVIITYQ